MLHMTVCRSKLREKVSAHMRQLQDNMQTKRDGRQYSRNSTNQTFDVEQDFYLMLIDDIVEAVDEHEYL